MLTIDVKPTYEAFLECSSSLPTFERKVHEHFFNDYFTEHEGKLTAIVENVNEKCEKVLIGSLIGKLANKIPPVYIKGFDKDYDEDLARKLTAAILVHCLIDGGTFDSDTKVKKSPEGKWETLTHIHMRGAVVKDLLKGIHRKPGVATQKKNCGWKLSSKDKKRLKRLSSIPFKLSDVATEELIWKGYTLKKDWNKRVDKNDMPLKEHPTTKKERYRGYLELIMGLGGIFYMELKYSSSGRMYYVPQLEGIRPQGKLWETLMVDSANPIFYSEGELEALYHIIYCTVTGGKVLPSTARDIMENNHEVAVDIYAAIEDMDPMNATTESEFGEYLLVQKAVKALDLYLAGKPSHYLFGWDFTNSGLMMAGLSFKEEKMLQAGNLYGGAVIRDSHTEFGNGLGLSLSRDDVKKIHTPLLHGSSYKGLADKVSALTGAEMSVLDIKKRVMEAYGPAAQNLVDIATWGIEALSNDQTSFSWTLPDGFKATHTAYFEKVELKLIVASADPRHEKTCKTSHTVISDMPYALDNAGNHYVESRSAKVRGLYATITHSIDSYVLRRVVDRLLDLGLPVMLKHDDYMVHPGSLKVVVDTCIEVFEELFNSNIYQDAINEIAANAKSGIRPIELVTGDAECLVKESEGFLMP